MIVLGIESSCDETAAAVVTDNGEILSNIILSQLEEHTPYGGVVPEIAARAHLDNMDRIIHTAIQEAGIALGDICGVAATCGPGLIGGLLVGAVSGKTLASILGKPFIAVNHLEGHALTPRLTDNLAFPFLLLLVSGGHSQILIVEGVGRYKRLGTTLDDAAGECFDKSAKILGLAFPGGPNVEKTAKNCRNPIAALKKFPLPTPMKGRQGCDFSFSGLKTAVRTCAQHELTQDEIADLCHSFQHSMSEVMADRCKNAIQFFLSHYKAETPTLVVAGGVSANLAIRSRLDDLTAKHNMRLYAPPLSLCGDNAAMIAWAGLEHLRLGYTSPLETKARPRWPLDPDAEKPHKSAKTSISR